MGLGCEVHKEVMMEERKVFGKGGGQQDICGSKVGGQSPENRGAEYKVGSGQGQSGGRESTTNLV